MSRVINSGLGTRHAAAAAVTMHTAATALARAKKALAKGDEISELLQLQ
jgi:hypothetical protein